ncbi:MAG: hypothetical protein HN494_12455, partial [Opitutae bacterium]|nr:hypothetical protein [Opitutae bacterium]
KRSNLTILTALTISPLALPTYIHTAKAKAYFFQGKSTALKVEPVYGAY